MPHTAAVGCIASTMRAALEPFTLAVTSVAKWTTLGSSKRKGPRMTGSVSPAWASRPVTEATASSCSWRSLGLSSSSWAQAGLRVPASTRQRKSPSRQSTSSSGVAPTSPSWLYVQQPGNRAASREAT